MDRSIKPGDDFYLYTNGEWIKRTEIPPDRAAISVFTALDSESNQRTAALIEEAAKANAAPGTNARKIANLYNSYMDEAAHRGEGIVATEATSRCHRGHQRQTRTGRQPLGKSLRSDVDALNNTNFHTPNLFGLWVAPGLTIPSITCLPPAGWPRVAGPGILSPRQ